MVNEDPHVIRLLTMDMLSSMPIYNVISSRLTKSFIERGNINAILAETDREVKEKLQDFKRIIGFLSEVKEVEFAVIKMQPIITHLGYDIDVLMKPEDIRPFLQRVRKRFQILHTELHEFTRRGFKVTIYLNGMKLNQIEIYTYIGWYNYFFISPEELLKFRKNAIFAFDDASFSTYVLSDLPAFIIDVMHTMFPNKYISLGDFIKILLYLERGFDLREYSLLGGKEIIMAVNCLVKNLETCLKDILSFGRCYIPLQHTLLVSVVSTFKNFFINKELDPDIYWKELRRILNAIWRRLTKTI